VELSEKKRILAIASVSVSEVTKQLSSYLLKLEDRLGLFAESDLEYTSIRSQF
jgi:hypothetical protein